MKINLIDSLLLDSSNLLPYIKNTHDFGVLSEFISLLMIMKKDILKESESSCEVFL